MSTITVLSTFEEENILKKLKDNAKTQCADTMREYVNCTRDKSFTIPIVCRDALKKMNECLNQYTNDTVRDQLREEALRKKLERRQQAAENKDQNGVAGAEIGSKLLHRTS
ncbi:hypothetical protein HK102_009257 [Quaeritorhiza haematococci]|nr:hypothetical protein HK102_009257 [Quaeritorhiza haematococci]